jgi:uncharacterized coiled-coil protein SlyX
LFDLNICKMMSRGQSESKQLMKNIHDQLKRLVEQMNDLQELTQEAGLEQEEIE